MSDDMDEVKRSDENVENEEQDTKVLTVKEWKLSEQKLDSICAQLAVLMDYIKGPSNSSVCSSFSRADSINTVSSLNTSDTSSEQSFRHFKEDIAPYIRRLGMPQSFKYKKECDEVDRRYNASLSQASLEAALENAETFTIALKNNFPNWLQLR